MLNLLCARARSRPTRCSRAWVVGCDQTHGVLLTTSSVNLIQSPVPTTHPHRDASGAAVGRPLISATAERSPSFLLLHRRNPPRRWCPDEGPRLGGAPGRPSVEVLAHVLPFRLHSVSRRWGSVLRDPTFLAAWLLRPCHPMAPASSPSGEAPRRSAMCLACPYLLEPRATRLIPYLLCLCVFSYSSACCKFWLRVTLWFG